MITAIVAAIPIPPNIPEQAHADLEQPDDEVEHPTPTLAAQRGLISRELRTEVLQGEFSAEQRLPTEAELSESYRVSRQTIRRAFQDLVADDLVYRVPGRGTYAKAAGDGYVRQVGSVDDLVGLSDDTGMKVLEPLTRRVDLIGAGRLRLPSDALFRLRLVRMHEGVVFCVTTVYLPPHSAGGSALMNCRDDEPNGFRHLTVVIASGSSWSAGSRWSRF